MFNLQPQDTLTEKEIECGMKLSIREGLATETMTVLTSGAFLTALSLLLGATNLQIGFIAALPAFSNISQLITIWLVKRFNNRRGISVLFSVLGRIPILVIGIIALFFPHDISIEFIILFLFFNFFFASMAGLTWNAWMKDLIPEKVMGTYFSRRSGYLQTLNVCLSLITALAIDYVKDNFPAFELDAYGIMFVAGGIIGLAGVLMLSRIPEPKSFLGNENVFRLFILPLKDNNFLRLLIFNSFWVFSLSIATPFFTVFLMNHMKYSISYIITLTIISQLCSIATIRSWGVFADRYSNKTILSICAPIYIICIGAWSFVGIYTEFASNFALLVGIYAFMGAATAGINLSLTNIGLKLAPRKEAIAYLSVKNSVTAVFSFMGPLIGGFLADYFANRHLNIRIEWTSPSLDKVFRILSLHQWNFLFIIGAVLALLSLEFLVRVKEVGEVEKNLVVKIMRSSIRNNLKDYFVVGNMLNWHNHLMAVIRKKKTEPIQDGASKPT
ncbi:MFS transporter [Emticicia fluvialis]|uniref:MFS transporter n=1 Tax=Emticicia fluvialis TaxID=2974474 RepID=UPI002165DFEC|nr:MFS transporter [Emticicia fluvialis]